MSESQRALKSIRAQILDGKIAVGSKISERAFAEQLSVSRSPIRFAVQQLMLEGLVEKDSTGKAVVLGLSEEDAVDLDELMQALDVLACKQAISRASASSLRSIRRYIDMFEASGPENTQETVNGFMYEIRKRVIESSGNSILLEVNDFLNDYYLRWNVKNIPLCRLIDLSRKTVDLMSDRNVEGTLSSYEEFNKAIHEQNRIRVNKLLATDSLPTFEEGFLSPQLQTLQVRNLQLISGKTEAEKIVERVRDQIISGDRLPGTSISARALASEFEASHFPAQQAVEILVSERLVMDNGPRRTASIRNIPFSEMHDIVETAIALDLHCTVLSTQRRDSYDLSVLRQKLAIEMKHAARSENSLELVNSIMDFRRALVSTAKNRFLHTANKVIESRLKWHFASLKSLRLVVQSDCLIFESILSRDQEMAGCVFAEILEIAVKQAGVLGQSVFAKSFRQSINAEAVSE